MTMVRLASKKFFFMISGRTELRIRLSGAKFDAEVDFDVHSAVASRNAKKLISETTKNQIFSNSFFRRFGARQAS